VERQSLSIRQFAAAVGVSHTEVVRQMKAAGIVGNPQGQGKPTLLSPADQDALSAVLFVPAPAAPSHHVEVVGQGMTVYQLATLATRGTDASLARTLQEQQLTQSLQSFQANRVGMREALLAMATEEGAQVGHEMVIAQMNAAMATYQGVQTEAGKSLGVLPTPPATEA
jgi:hypothetical protein